MEDHCRPYDSIPKLFNLRARRLLARQWYKAIPHLSLPAWRRGRAGAPGADQSRPILPYPRRPAVVVSSFKNQWINTRSEYKTRTKALFTRFFCSPIRSFSSTALQFQSWFYLILTQQLFQILTPEGPAMTNTAKQKKEWKKTKTKCCCTLWFPIFTRFSWDLKYPIK